MAETINVIGDPHGCIKTLQKLLQKLPNGRNIIIGDIIDRGPGSYQCYKLVKEQQIEMVVGNHEYMFLQRNEGKHLLGLWLMNGGDAAMRDIERHHPNKKSLQSALAEMDAFFQHLPDKIVLESEGTTLLLSHAGVEEYIYELTRQNLQECFQVQYDSPRSFLWTRGQLAKIPGTIQVVGHTPTPNGPKQDKYGNWYIDTGCFLQDRPGSGYLSALVFTPGKFNQPQKITQQNIEDD